MDRTAGVDFLDTHSHYSSDSASHRTPSSSGEWAPPSRPPTHGSLNSMVEDLMRTTRYEVEGFQERLEVLEEEKNTIKKTISTYTDFARTVVDAEQKLYVLDLRMQSVEHGIKRLDARLQVVETDVKEMKTDVKEMSSNIQLILAHLNIQPVNIERVPESAPPPEEASKISDSVEKTPPPMPPAQTIPMPPPSIPVPVQQSEIRNSFSRSLPSLPEPARELEEEMNNLSRGMLKFRGNLTSFLRKSMANLRQ